MVQIKSLRKSGAFLTPRASCYSQELLAEPFLEHHVRNRAVFTPWLPSADVGVFRLLICTFICLLSYPLIYSFIILEFHYLYLLARTAFLSSPVPVFPSPSPAYSTSAVIPLTLTVLYCCKTPIYLIISLRLPLCSILPRSWFPPFLLPPLTWCLSLYSRFHK